jgi:hypothetical protein
MTTIMILNALKLFFGGANMLTKIVMILSIVGTLIGGVTTVYYSIKARGAAEATTIRWETEFNTLKLSSDEALATLQLRYDKQVSAAAKRRLAEEVQSTKTSVVLTQLNKELEDARKTDVCIDKLLPPVRAERVRQLSIDASNVLTD